MKKIILLGSTGSIGRSTIEIVRRLKKYRIAGIATYGNHQMLAAQARAIKPDALGMLDLRNHEQLKPLSKRSRVYFGEAGLTDMIEDIDADILVAAFSSSVAIGAIIRAIEKKMRICLATKEILVSYGEIVMRKINRYKTRIYPIDSEHSAIFQCLQDRAPSEVLNIFLTATGGPFLNRSTRHVTKNDVLDHPVWKMGKKITVDSATMMNKGLEVIEARHLFQVPPEKIKVVIHPDAICHSLVQFVDSSILCQLSSPNMKLPIQYALTAPRRFACPIPYLDIRKVTALNFEYPDTKKFPCLDLAFQALKISKSMPAVLNGANDAAVRAFLEDRLGFNDIPAVISETMSRHKPVAGGIKEYRLAELWARATAKDIIRILRPKKTGG